jgi:hypothetical protein
MGALEHDVSVTPLDGGGARISLERTLPAMVPDFVRPLVGDTIRRSADRGLARGSPGRVAPRGDAGPDLQRAGLAVRRHVAAADQRRHDPRLDATIKARIPFVGGRIEQGIGEVILLAARKEEEVGARWLAGHRD